MTGKIYLDGADALLSDLKNMLVPPGLPMWKFEPSAGESLLLPSVSSLLRTTSQQCGESVSDCYAKVDNDPSKQEHAGVGPIYARHLLSIRGFVHTLAHPKSPLYLLDKQSQVL